MSKLSDPDLSWEEKQTLLKSFMDQSQKPKISLEEFLDEHEHELSEAEDQIKKS